LEIFILRPQFVRRGTVRPAHQAAAGLVDRIEARTVPGGGQGSPPPSPAKSGVKVVAVPKECWRRFFEYGGGDPVPIAGLSAWGRLANEPDRLQRPCAGYPS